MRTIIPAGTLLPNGDGSTPATGAQYVLTRAVAATVEPNRGGILEYGAVTDNGKFTGDGASPVLALDDLLRDLALCFERLGCECLDDPDLHYLRSHVRRLRGPYTIVVPRGTPIPDQDGEPVYRLSRGVRLELREDPSKKPEKRWRAWPPADLSVLGGFGPDAGAAIEDCLCMLGVLRAIGRVEARPHEEEYDFALAHTERIAREGTDATAAA